MNENKNNEFNEMDEMNENIVELVDENGESVQFEHLDTLEYQGNTYIVLTPLDEVDADESDVYIMQIQEDEEGEDILEIVEDADLIEAIFEEFRTRTEGDFDFID